jgi:hypothetical protein
MRALLEGDVPALRAALTSIVDPYTKTASPDLRPEFARALAPHFLVEFGEVLKQDHYNGSFLPILDKGEQFPGVI